MVAIVNTIREVPVSDYRIGRTFLSAFQAVEDITREDAINDLKRKKPRSTAEKFSITVGKDVNNSHTPNGYALMAAIRKTLNDMPVKRSSDQIRMHEAMLQAITPGM